MKKLVDIDYTWDKPSQSMQVALENGQPVIYAVSVSGDEFNDYISCVKKFKLKLWVIYIKSFS